MSHLDKHELIEVESSTLVLIKDVKKGLSQNVALTIIRLLGSFLVSLTDGTQIIGSIPDVELTSTGNYDLFVVTIIFSRWSGFLFVRTHLTLLKELLFWDLSFLVLFKELIIQNQDLKTSIGDYLSV